MENTTGCIPLATAPPELVPHPVPAKSAPPIKPINKAPLYQSQSIRERIAVEPTDNNPNTTTRNATDTTKVPVPTEITPVHAEPIGPEPEIQIIEPERRLSALAWLAAIVLFIFNRKLGIVFFIVLLFLRKYPTINFKALARKRKPQQNNRSQ